MSGIPSFCKFNTKHGNYMTSARHKQNSFMLYVEEPMSKKGFVFEWTSLIIRHFVLGNCMQVLNETSEDIWKSKWTFALTNRFLNYVLVTHCIISFQAIENSTQNKKVRISSFLKIRPSFALWPNSRSPSWQIVILSNVEHSFVSYSFRCEKN